MAKRIVVQITDEKDGVTGTCQLLHCIFPERIWSPTSKYCKDLDLMIDCGMAQGFQGSEEFNKNFKYDYSNVAMSILTHAHLDHYVLFPRFIMLTDNHNPIFTSYVTKTFLDKVALEDCLKLTKRAAKKSGNEALYDEKDVNHFRASMVGCGYNYPITFNDNITIYFFPNGHEPGAVVTLLQIQCKEYEPINIIITGDYKDSNLFFEVPSLPTWVTKLPNVTILTESTYGTTLSSDMPEPCMIENILKALRQDWIVFIPAFAFGRAQEILYKLQMAQSCGKLDPRIPIYLDGKTTQENTNLYALGAFEMFPYMKNFLPKNFNYVLDKSSRKSLIEDGIPKIIISSSGMATHGPSHSYIRRLLPNSKALIHFAGYLSPDSTGGKLMNAPIGSEITIDSKKIIKAATVLQTRENSAHSNAEIILKFCQQFQHLKSVGIHHGEEDVKNGFNVYLKKNLKSSVRTAILDSHTSFIVTSDGIVSCHNTDTN